VELEEHLFRHEAGRLVAILTRLFGIQNLALAEDVVQEAFCRALETWKFHGTPRNPSAWLMATAKHAALDALRREATAHRFAPEVARLLESEWTRAVVIHEAFDRGGIEDDQLRMMFSCIHPDIPIETQLGLTLHLVCGFGMDETAAAFLKGRAAMEKRLRRAKETLARSLHLFDLAGDDDVAARLPAVLQAIYLLFNEGYHGASTRTPIRAELCAEALRLGSLLLQNPRTSTPAAHALAALMNFHAARLPARVDEGGDLVTLDDQRRSRWDAAMTAEGRRQLQLSAAGDELTSYHVEAAIAELHADASSLAETDWSGIIALYDTLLRILPSPIVALNRAVAIAQRDGAAAGLEAIAQIGDRERLLSYPFYFSAIGELELRRGHHDAAGEAFTTALAHARNATERRFLQSKLRAAGAAENRKG